jgi:hypothetical protein
MVICFLMGGKPVNALRDEGGLTSWQAVNFVVESGAFL